MIRSILTLALLCTTAAVAQVDTTMKTFTLDDRSTIVAQIIRGDSTWWTMRTLAGDTIRIRRSFVDYAERHDGTLDVPALASEPEEPEFPDTWTITRSTGAPIEEVGILEIRDDSLVLNRGYAPVAIRDLVAIERREGSHFWEFTPIGGAFGVGMTAVGLAFSAPRQKPGALLIGSALTVASGLATGLIGALIPAHNEVELAEMAMDERRIELERIVAQDAIDRAESLREREEERVRRAERAARRKARSGWR